MSVSVLVHLHCNVHLFWVAPSYLCVGVHGYVGCVCVCVCASLFIKQQIIVDSEHILTLTHSQRLWDKFLFEILSPVGHFIHTNAPTLHNLPRTLPIRALGSSYLLPSPSEGWSWLPLGIRDAHKTCLNQAECLVQLTVEGAHWWDFWECFKSTEQPRKLESLALLKSQPMGCVRSSMKLCLSCMS